MASDYITEQMAEEDRQSLHEQNMREVAIYMLKGKTKGEGMTENEARAHVEQIQWEREDAHTNRHIIEDGDGNFDSYIEDRLNGPSEDGLNPKQIYVLQQKLLED